MKIFGIGRNYAAHIEELNNERPDEPVIFMMPETALLHKNRPFYYPAFTKDVHFEVEVILKISKVGKNIEQKFANTYYDEIGVGIDFTARDLQQKAKEKGLPWEKAKGFDGSSVVGKFVSKEVLNTDRIHFQLIRNGDVVQEGDSSHMLWKIDEIIAYVSQFFTLKIGDLIFTGTPAGVGRVEPDDVLEGKLEGMDMFRVKVK